MMRKNLSLDSIKKLEGYLSSKLRPVKPRQGFIKQLQSQFSSAKSVIMEKKDQTIKFFLIVFGVVASAIVLLLLGKPKSKKSDKALSPQQ